MLDDNFKLMRLTSALVGIGLSLLLVGLIEILLLLLIVPIVNNIMSSETHADNEYIVLIKKLFQLEDSSQLIFIFLILLIIKLVLASTTLYTQSNYLFKRKHENSNAVFGTFISSSFQRRGILNLLTNELSQLQQYYYQPYFIILSETVLLFCISFAVIYELGLPAILTLIGLLLIGIIYQFISKLSIKRIGQRRIITENQRVDLLEAASKAFLEIRYFGRSAWVNNKYVELTKTLQRLESKHFFVIQLPRIILEVIAIITLLTFATLHQLLNEKASAELAGAVALFSVALFKALPSLRRIAIALQNFSYSSAAVSATYEFRKQEHKNPLMTNENFYISRVEDSSMLIEHGDIMLERGGFKKDITAAAFRKGSNYLIHGRSGSGKSSYLTFLLDKYLGENKNRTAALCRQDNVLFPGTIKDNITMSDKALNDEELKKLKWACRLAKVDWEPFETIMEIEINPVSNAMSGGQLQRVCIARALYYAEDLIFLDEFSSALDGEIEKIVTDNIVNSGLTCIMISHSKQILNRTDIIKICLD